MVCLDSNGATFTINVPVALSDRSVCCQAMIADIDERKRMEEALRDSEAHLREENIRLRSTIEKRHIAAALAEHRWNRTRTARSLGIGLRTLQRKMKAYGIQ